MTGTRYSTEVIPHPRHRLPLLGDILTTDPRRPTQREYELAQQLGPIYELQFGPEAKMVVVTGTDLAHEVWDDTRFEKFVAPPLRKLRDIVGDGLFMAYGSEPVWGIAHRILTPGFVKTAMGMYHAAMIDSIEYMFTSWDRTGSDPRIDLSRDLNSLTFELIGRAGFSETFGAFDHGTELHPFLTQLNRSMSWISSASNTTHLLRALLGRHHERQYREDIAAIHAFGAEIAAKRAVQPRQGPKDLLDLMLTTDDPETGEKLPTDNIAYQVVGFLLAGQETTAGTLAFATHYLMQQPDIAEAIRAEVKDVTDGGPITYDQVAKLRYTRRVIDETLRLWPTAPGYFRRALHDQMLGERWHIRKGQPLFLLTLGLHRNSDWPDPLRFDPDRFLPERAAQRGPYKPFGVGARACIGRQFALHEAVLTLAMMVDRYTFTPDKDYRLNVHEQLTIRPKNLHTTITKRGA